MPGHTTALVLFIAALAAPSAQAQTAEDFYKGKRITITVGYGPGGGYDVFSRLLARYLGRHIPGNPQIVVQNMPGAGSLTAANYLFSHAPKDGTAFGTFSRDMALLALMGHNPSVQFEPRKFTWLGSSSNFADDAYALIARDDAPVKSVADMRNPDGPLLVLGGSADGSTSSDVPKILQAALGLRFKLVIGYRDSAAVYLAMERNEVSGRTIDLSGIRSVKPDWLKPGGGYHLLIQYARLTRHPDFPDVPTARELALTDEGRKLIEFTETPLLTMARPFAAPPDVPADRVAILQTGFMAAHRDPQFLDEAAKLGIYVSPVSGQDIVSGIDKMSRASPDLFDKVRKLLGRDKNG